MSLTVARDPSKRLGGWALVRLPAGASGSARVVVSRDGGTLFLGPHGWQGGEHAFGPYPIETDSRGALLRVGPEIVNQMEAYVAVEIAVPECAASAALSWPDEILPAPDTLEGDSVRVAAEPGEPAKPPPAGLSGRFGDRSANGSPIGPPAHGPSDPSLEQISSPGPRPAPPQPAPALEPAARPATTNEGDEAEPARKRSPLRWIVPLLVLLLAAGAGTFWWWSQQPGEPVPDEPVAGEPAPAPEPAPPPPEPEAEACTRDDLVPVLRSQEATPDRLWSLVELCRSAGDRDLEVRVLERLVALEDAEALRQFAQWYDPREDADDSPFGTEVENAVLYYARARAAGSAKAAADLEGLCTMLRGETDLTARRLVAIHCE